MKVYCKNCKYSEYSNASYYCRKIKEYVDRYDEIITFYYNAIYQNENNDCKFYEPSFFYKIKMFFKKG